MIFHRRVLNGHAKISKESNIGTSVLKNRTAYNVLSYIQHTFYLAFI